MENILINYFSNLTKLTEEEKAALEDSMTIKQYAKGHYLVKEGQYNAETYFVLSGLVRQFKLLNGNDVTTNFYSEEQWIISIEGENGAPSDYNLLCMEDTSVVIGDEEKAQELFSRYPRLERVSRQILESAFAKNQSVISAYITDKPEQRYLRLMETRADLLQRAPQYDIATYIGVKPESLSRIRKKLQSR